MEKTPDSENRRRQMNDELIAWCMKWGGFPSSTKFRSIQIYAGMDGPIELSTTIIPECGQHTVSGV